MSKGKVSKMPSFPDSLTGRYEILRPIGQGGMGAIYEARHRILDRAAAVKLLTGFVFDEEDAVKRFEDEARVCSSMKHPNIVQVYDFDIRSAPPYIVFELVDGPNLKQLMKAGRRLSLCRILRMMAQVFNGLEHAHRLGIVHRDLKPANLLIDRTGTVKIADFGLAKMAGVTSSKTKTGMVLGTPLYMSPEQATEKKVGPAGDIYSCGVILFEMLAGATPFAGENDMEILLAHVREEAPLVSDFNRDMPVEIDRLCSSLLRKSPARRPQGASRLAGKLERLADRFEREGRDIPVKLGRLRGRPRPKKKKRLSLDISQIGSEVASAIITKTQDTMVSKGRKITMALIGLAVGALLVCGLLSLAAMSGWLGREYSVFDLAVKARGSRGVVVTWRCDWKATRDQVIVTHAGMPVDVDVRILSVRPGVASPDSDGKGVRLSVEPGATGRPCCEAPGASGKASPDKEGAAGFFLHTALVRGLVQEEDYAVALRRPDGERTLFKRFSTVRAQPFHPSASAVVGEGKIDVLVEARSPFVCKLSREASDAGGLGLERECRLYGTRCTFSLPLDALDPGARIRIRAVDIDGTVSARSYGFDELLAEPFQSAFEDFMVEYRSGAFFRYWKTRHRLNDLFHKKAQVYNSGAMTGRPERERRRFIESFWDGVMDDLGKKSSWFETTWRMLPAVETMSRRGVFRRSSRLAEAAAKMLLPLRLIEGAALWYNLAPCPRWRKALSADCNPLPWNLQVPRQAQVREFVLESYADLGRTAAGRAGDGKRPGSGSRSGTGSLDGAAAVEPMNQSGTGAGDPACSGEAPFFMISMNHPSQQRLRSWFRFNYGSSGLPDAMILRHGYVRLPGDVSEDVSRVFLVVPVYSRYETTALVVRFADSDYCAVFCEYPEEHIVFSRMVRERERMRLRSDHRPRIYSGPSEGDVIRGGLDDKYPDPLVRCQSVPVEKLHPGLNKVELYVLGGPTEMSPRYSFARPSLHLVRNR